MKSRKKCRAYPCVLLWLLQKGGEVLVAFLVLVTRLPPFGNRLAVEDENVEEGVEEEDVGRLDRGGIQEHRLSALLIKCVRVEGGLDHDERVADIFVVEDMPVECRLVRRVVEDLQELTPSQVEHELWVQGKVLFEAERRRVVFAVVGEPRA